MYVIPQGLICNGEEGRAHLNLDFGLPCAQQAIPILLLLLVGAGKRDSTTVGTSALVMEDKNLKEPSAQVDTGPSHLENSESHLEAQLDSLAEVLQNQRGLGFFMIRRSLCGTGRN